MLVLQTTQRMKKLTLKLLIFKSVWPFRVRYAALTSRHQGNEMLRDRTANPPFQIDVSLIVTGQGRRARNASSS